MLRHHGPHLAGWIPEPYIASSLSAGFRIGTSETAQLESPDGSPSEPFPGLGPASKRSIVSPIAVEPDPTWAAHPKPLRAVADRPKTDGGSLKKTRRSRRRPRFRFRARRHGPPDRELIAGPTDARSREKRIDVGSTTRESPNRPPQSVFKTLQH